MIPRRFRFSASLLAVMTAACFSSAISAQSGRTIYAGNAAFHAQLASNGHYEMRVLATGWTLQGALAGGSEDVEQTQGADRIGAYHQLAASSGGRTRAIRLYDQLPIALLSDAWRTDGANTNPFPTFQSFPSGLMHISFQEREFGPYTFGALQPEGPWAFFNARGQTLLLSPADHFPIARLEQDAGGATASRILASIDDLPKGFSHGTLLVFGSGVNAAFAQWGAALLALSGKTPPTNDADPVLAKLGYWTDNGSYYYYKYASGMDYRGTLLAIRDEFARAGAPLGYFQLDSWWYPKGPDAKWNANGPGITDGEYRYEAHKELFPDGLAAFQKRLDLPLVTHARWIAPSSPYHQQYQMSQNTITDPRFWNATAQYLRASGVIDYEQDWLNHNALPALDLHAPDAFLGNMASAMEAQGLAMQYCMPLPSDYMASTLYPAVRTIRTSDDRFERKKWDSFLYDSRLASALGVWPWTDVFMSTELPNLILSTLSAGPVGVGDALGALNATNLHAAIRSDGVLVKPDRPILPLDRMYLSDGAGATGPMIAAAESEFSPLRAVYLFAYPRTPATATASVPLHELGIHGGAYAYDWRTHTGAQLAADGRIDMRFADGWAYQVVVPVTHSGLALLGDAQQIAPLGRKRVAALAQENGALLATVLFAPGEQTRTLTGFAHQRPQVTSSEGRIAAFAFDDATHLFTVQVSPGPGGQAKVRIAPGK